MLHIIVNTFVNHPRRPYTLIIEHIAIFITLSMRFNLHSVLPFDYKFDMTMKLSFCSI